MPQTSFIIRTKNEEKYLGQCLEAIFSQTDRDFEVVIIDSGSTDKTLDIARKFPVKILEIPPEKFSYPFALNYAIERCGATKYLAFLSGHSIPISKTWLEDGIKDFSRYEKIMCVYSFLRPLPDAGFWTKVIMWFSEFQYRLRNNFKELRYLVDKPGVGFMGFTNAIILKELWDKKHFNEEYGLGGEDGEWGSCWLERGYKALRDEKLRVYHSHDLGLIGWYRQRKYWGTLSKPQPFRPLPFRKDKAHRG